MVGRKRNIWYGLAAAALLWSGAAGAMPVERLYEAQIPVAGQGADERAAAIRSALAEVLVRVTGERGVIANPAAADVFSDPSQLLQQYRYVRTPTDAPAAAVAPLELQVRFDSRALEQALRQHGLPFWGRERPLTLVWLAVEDGSQRYLVSGDADNEARTQLQEVARRRGLPVLFPLMDLEDQSHVRFADVWGGFLDQVKTASARYHTPAILVGRVNRDASGGWTGRWDLILEGVDTRWTGSGPDLDGTLADGMDQTADRMAAHFALQPGQGAGARVSLGVDGIHGIADYARVSHYLAALTQVQNLAVSRVDGARMDFDVTVDGDPANLDQAIGLGSVLKPVPGQAAHQFDLRP